MPRKWSKISLKPFRRARFDKKKPRSQGGAFLFLKDAKLVFTFADNQTFALGRFAGQFANTAHAFRFFAARFSDGFS